MCTIMAVVFIYEHRQSMRYLHTHTIATGTHNTIQSTVHTVKAVGETCLDKALMCPVDLICKDVK
jgi:hypothetical protein